MSRANLQTLSNINHPLAHCQARMALYYNYVELSKIHPYGNRAVAAAVDDYHRHIGIIEDEEKNCVVCKEHDERRGKHASRERELFLDSSQRSAGSGGLLAGDQV